MRAAAVTLFLSLLTLAAQVAVGITLTMTLAGRHWPAAARARTWLVAPVAHEALPLALLVALTATAGSLSFSEFLRFVPCTLCWYQRTAMYPLVPILAIAAWRHDLAVRPYARALALIGFSIAAYHYLLERVPWLEAGVCDPATPCTVVWVWRFHYISIPLMAATAFGLITLLLHLAGATADGVEVGPSSPAPGPDARRTEQ